MSSKHLRHVRREFNTAFRSEDDQLSYFRRSWAGFGVTRERIRQIEAKALRKLRHPMRSKRLKDYLE